MDSSASEIVFTETGCSFCDRAKVSLEEIKDLEMPQIKGKQYDCLIGLSGGVDSSYLLHKVVEKGLRPMCFSVDNGWNDPRADENIMRLVEGLRVPFFRYVLDLPKFKTLQSAFLMAGQKNVEIATDHVLMAMSYELADKYGIKWILSGGNVATESIMPESWGYQPRDLVHIKDVYRKMIGKELKGLPVCGLLKWNWYKWVKGIKTFYPLDVWGYNRQEAIHLLESKYGYMDYGEKHGENVWTKWFQNFYLYEKFGIDKRKAHLSSMIVSGHMTRDDALRELARKPVYPELGIERRVMKYPIRNYWEFRTDEKLFKFISKVVKLCKS